MSARPSARAAPHADTPFEACIGFTVLPKLKRDDAPNFLGRAALEKQRADGLRRRCLCPYTPILTYLNGGGFSASAYTPPSILLSLPI